MNEENKQVINQVNQQQVSQQQVTQQESQNKSSNKAKRGMTVLVLLLLLVAVTVGYSALSTTLNINGTSTIGVPTWDIHFQNVSTTTGSVTATTAPTIQTGNTSITYAVTLENPGDFYEFTVEAKNFGSMNAKLSAAPTISGVSSAQDVYVNYTVKYSDGTTPAINDTLNVNQVRTYRVRVEFDPNINASQLPTTSQNLTLTCSIPYVQA